MTQAAAASCWGVRDLYGFWDLSGEATLELTARQLVYGSAKWQKPTMVLAPTLAREPETVLADLQNR